MAITKGARPKPAADALIGGAPDAKPRFVRGKKAQITLTISPGLLDRVDAVARRKEISRAALLTLWIGDRLEQEAA